MVDPAEIARELKPCPFCGCSNINIVAHPGAGRGMIHHGETFYSIGCYECGGEVPARYREDILIAAWNRRADA